MYKFENGSRVCFFGDSITANGTWMRRILQYYRENTDIRFEMYNCGVPGDNASAAFLRIYETLLVYDPTDVVIMFGMNDVGRNFYGNQATSTNILNRRMMIDNCINAIKNIANDLMSRGIRVSFCSPTPYDEFAEIEEKNLIGVQAALLEVGERIKAFSEDFGGQTVDFNSEMFSVLKKLYKTGETFISPDRVHPTPAGHELMASIFLKSQGFDVEIPDTVQKMNELASRPFGEWEEERFSLEKRIVEGSFIDRCMYKGVKNSDNIRKIISEIPAAQRTPFMEKQFMAFEERDRGYEENMKKLIEYTKTVFSN